MKEKCLHWLNNDSLIRAFGRQNLSPEVVPCENAGAAKEELS